jgi:hypothetical protein
MALYYCNFEGVMIYVFVSVECTESIMSLIMLADPKQCRVPYIGLPIKMIEHGIAPSNKSSPSLPAVHRIGSLRTYNSAVVQ